MQEDGDIKLQRFEVCVFFQGVRQITDQHLKKVHFLNKNYCDLMHKPQTQIHDKSIMSKEEFTISVKKKTTNQPNKKHCNTLTWV